MKMETSCNIRVNGTESDCSNLFEGIHPAFTIVQACIALLVVIFGVPLNVLLVVALIKYCHLLDEAFILCASIFVANTVVSFAMGTNLFLSSATRSWPLGYIGCEVYGFLTYSPIPVRWLTLGMLSIDRFCRVFFPFRYARHSKTVLRILLVFPWIYTVVSNIFTLTKVLRTYYFTTTLPGCFHRSYCQESTLCLAIVATESTIILGAGSVLPIVLYTILYIKSRLLLRAVNKLSMTNAQQKADRERQNKATKTFALMVITFSCYSAVLFIIVVLRLFPAIRDKGGVLFLLYDFTLLYLVTDFLLIWKNKNGKHVIKKLINTVLQRQVFSIESVASAPTSSTSNQKQSSTDNLVPTPTPSQELPRSVTPMTVIEKQLNTLTPPPAIASGEDQQDTSLPASRTDSHQEQLNLGTTSPKLVSGQEESVTSRSTPCDHLDQEQQETTSNM